MLSVLRGDSLRQPCGDFYLETTQVTTKELIALLRKADPKGIKHVELHGDGLAIVEVIKL